MSGPEVPSPAHDVDDNQRHRSATAADDAGLSLDALSNAFAELLVRGDDPYGPASESRPPGKVDTEAPPLEPVDESIAAADEACDITPRSIVEAMLFVGHPENEPLTSQQVAALMRGVRPQEIDDIVRELNAEYAADGAPYEVALDGPGYRLQLRPEFAPLRDKFHGRVREARLSQAAVDVLAIVAYHQGASPAQVDQLRGKPSAGVLSQLVRRGLLRLERSPTDRRDMHYFTTDRFLSLLRLGSLDELPKSQELDRHW